MIGAGETLGVDVGAIEGKDNMEPALSLGVEETARVGDRGAKLVWIRAAIDGRRVTIETVEVSGSGERISGSVKDLECVVDGFEDETIASTETLIGRFNREL